MSEMSQELKDYYLKEADNHADFLTEKVFKPAFVMAFIHGVKHGREDEQKELEASQKLHEKKVKLKDVLNSEAKQDFTQAAIEGNSMITIGGNTYILHRER